MLTAMQQKALAFISDRIVATGGIAPSISEIAAGLDLRSKGGAHRLVSGLEDRGFIRRLHHKARSIEVLRLPTDTLGLACPHCGRALHEIPTAAEIGR